ncbi:Outer cell wall protein precursor [compost metagenome]
MEKALEANKETEVKFTYKDKEYTHKVTYVTTVAQKVESVSAKNLKEVVVVFDGTVEKKSAESKLNYEVKDQKVDSVKLSDDKKTATILLEEGTTLTNQKETEVKVKNVKNEDATKTIEQTVKFTPVDVQIPEIKEVVGLGTSAFKVVFSEPVQKSDVYASSNYKVDGVSVSGNVEYSYPNVAIINASLPTGDHKLTVSNIRDYSGLKIAPVEQAFTIAQDTAAPEVVSIKSNDLTEVEIEFNESIKTWSKVYHGVSGNTGIVTKRDNKLIVTFSKPLSLAENTVYIEGVTDYSGNKANREAKVNPTLDTERPTVNKVEVKQDDVTGYHYLEIQFSKKVSKESAEKRTNYTIKNKDGKAVSGTGLDNDGHPYSTPSYDADKNTVTVKLGTKLDTADYTVEVAGVVDTAYVANTMLPYSATISAKQTIGDAITRVWYKKDGNENILYVQYRVNVKTSGDGRADLAEKYLVNGKTLKDVDVDVVSGDTVRIKTTKNDLNLIFKNDGSLDTNTISAQLIQDVDGNFFKQSGSYTLTASVATSSKLTVIEAKATSRQEVKVKFDGKINSFTASDFRAEVPSDLTGTGTKVVVPDSASLSADGITLTLSFNDNNKLPAYLNAAKLVVVTSPSTSDAQGTAISNASATLKDEIKPEFNDSLSVKVISVTDSTYKLILTGNDKVNISSAADAKRVLEVKYGGDTLTIDDVTVANINQLVIEVKLPAIDTSKYFNVEIKGDANAQLKAIVDDATTNNAYAGNKIGGQFSNVYSN